MGLAPRRLDIPVRIIVPAGGVRHRGLPSAVTRQAFHPVFPHPRGGWRGRGPRRNPRSVGGVWDRFADDRDLIGLKIALLVGLITLTAVLGRAV